MAHEPTRRNDAVRYTSAARSPSPSVLDDDRLLTAARRSVSALDGEGRPRHRRRDQWHIDAVSQSDPDGVLAGRQSGEGDVRSVVWTVDAQHAPGEDILDRRLLRCRLVEN